MVTARFLDSTTEPTEFDVREVLARVEFVQSAKETRVVYHDVLEDYDRKSAGWVLFNLVTELHRTVDLGGASRSRPVEENENGMIGDSSPRGQ